MMNFSKLILAAAVVTTLAACEGDDGSDGAAGAPGADGAPGANGANSLIAQTPLAAGDPNCAGGGTQVDSGVDDNGDGVLDADEIDATSYVCNGDSGASGALDLDKVARLLETNANIALSAYLDSVDTAKALKAAIEALAANPTQATLDAAKLAWLVAREPYGQTEVYRFRLSPIDSTNYMDEDGPEGDINAWPLGEALIDAVVTNPATSDDFEADQVGVVESSTPIASGGAVDGSDNTINIIASDVTIDEALISNTATAEDERDVIAGYHAIEFLLWGQDLNNTGTVTVGTDRETAVKSNGASNIAAGGQRPVTDFTTDAGAARRLQYLQVAVDKLIADLEGVVDGWRDGVVGNYRDQFTTITGDEDALEKLTEILTGMGTLSEGELAGERMQIAFSANSQEDEHSCFADNTHRDILLNNEGIANSFYGDYSGYDADLDGMDGAGDNTDRAVSGYGFDDFAADIGGDVAMIAEALDAAVQTSMMTAGDIDASARAGSPVDVLIQSANLTEDNPMFTTILALNAQSVEIANLAEALEIEVDVVDDDASACDTTNPTEECGE